MHVCIYPCKLAYIYMHMCMSVDTDKWVKRLTDARQTAKDKTRWRLFRGATWAGRFPSTSSFPPFGHENGRSAKDGRVTEVQ